MESLGLDGNLELKVRWDLICKQSVKAKQAEIII